MDATRLLDLPSEMIENIYTHLPDSASRRAFAHTSSFMRSSVLSQITTLKISCQALQRFDANYNRNPLRSFPKGAQLKFLSVQGSSRRSCVDFYQLSKMLNPPLQHLQALTLTGIYVESHLFNPSIVGWHYDSPFSTAQCLGRFLRQQPQLRVLRIQRDANFDNDDLCPLLDALEGCLLDELHLVADAGFKSAHILAISHLTHLTHLTLLRPTSAPLDAPSLAPLASLPSLRQLSFMKSGSVGDLSLELDFLKMVSSRAMPSFRHLELVDPCFGSSFDSTAAIRFGTAFAVCFSSCPSFTASLVHLTVSCVDVDAFFTFCSLAPSLTENTDSIELQVDPDGKIERLAHFCPNLTKLSICKIEFSHMRPVELVLQLRHLNQITMVVGWGCVVQPGFVREVLDVCTAASAWERSYDIFVSVSQHSAGNKAWANEVLGELPLQWNALALSLKPYQSGLFCFEVRLHVKVV